MYYYIARSYKKTLNLNAKTYFQKGYVQPVDYKCIWKQEKYLECTNYNYFLKSGCFVV